MRSQPLISVVAAASRTWSGTAARVDWLPQWRLITQYSGGYDNKKVQSGLLPAPIFGTGCQSRPDSEDRDRRDSKPLLSPNQNQTDSLGFRV